MEAPAAERHFSEIFATFEQLVWDLAKMHILSTKEKK